VQERRLIHLTQSACAPADASPIAVFGSRAQDNDCGAGLVRPSGMVRGGVREAEICILTATGTTPTSLWVRPRGSVYGKGADEALRYQTASAAISEHGWTRAREPERAPHTTTAAGLPRHEGGISGVRDGSSSDYTQIPQGHHDQEDALDSVPAVGRARPRRRRACRSRGALGELAAGAAGRRAVAQQYAPRGGLAGEQ